MKDKVLKKKLYKIAMLQKELDYLYEDVEEEFEDCLDFKPYKILRGCTIETMYYITLTEKLYQKISGAARYHILLIKAQATAKMITLAICFIR